MTRPRHDARAAQDPPGGRRRRQATSWRAPTTASWTACFDLIDKYGGVDAINRDADEAGGLEHPARAPRATSARRSSAASTGSREQRDAGAFVSLPEYRRSVLGARRRHGRFDEHNAVTLEISALQYFPWLIDEARAGDRAPRAHARRATSACATWRSRARPASDILAVAAAMQIIGATHVETLDTRGIDGSNVHLGGPDTITGYFGGIGQPNDYPLKWADEYLHVPDQVRHPPGRST